MTNPGKLIPRVEGHAHAGLQNLKDTRQANAERSQCHKSEDLGWMYKPTLSQAWTRENPCPQYAFKVSMLICPAVHIPTRSLLRSSSTPEPSDPPYSIVFNKRLTKTWPFSQKTVRVDSSSRGGDQQNEPGRGRRALSGFKAIER